VLEWYYCWGLLRCACKGADHPDAKINQGLEASSQVSETDTGGLPPCLAIALYVQPRSIHHRSLLPSFFAQSIFRCRTTALPEKLEGSGYRVVVQSASSLFGGSAGWLRLKWKHEVGQFCRFVFSVFVFQVMSFRFFHCDVG